MKFLLVDDHALFRDGLALLVSHEFPQLTLLQAADLAEAERCLDRHPDLRLVLLDLSLPDSEGLDGLQRLRARAEHVIYVVLSADQSTPTILAAIDAGAAGFIPKTTQSGVMLAALRTILAGGVYLPDGVAARRAAPPDGGTGLGLSPRQADVLRLLIEGKTNKLICRDLGLSESTVKTHLEAIFRRLEVSTRTQAVVAAARLGLRLGEPLNT